jgi:hypothetical protein
MHSCRRSSLIARWRSISLWGALATLGALALAAFLAEPASSQVPPPPVVHPAGPVPPLDQALRHLYEARAAYQNVRDYTCLFVKREQVRGVMMPENVMTMKVRARPYSVYFRWQAPKNLEGQEACFVTGANNGQMRVHTTGLASVAGWVSIDPRDPRALKDSRHTINESGIGNLIEKYIERWELEKKIGRTEVRIADYDFAKRRCTRIEAIHPGSQPGQYYSYRGVLYIDKETKLPIRSECYDWPRPGGPPDGALLECFSYVDLKFNVNLPPNAFAY